MKTLRKLVAVLAVCVFLFAVIYPPFASVDASGPPVFQGFTWIWSLKAPFVTDPHYYPADLTLVFSIVGMIIVALV